MRRFWIIAGLVAVLVAVASYGYNRFLRTETVRIDDRFYVVLGGGGNTAVLLADDGALVVDTKFAYPGRRLARVVESVTDMPVKVIINTHYHFDHTHGNVNYPHDADVVAQRRTRQHMIELDKRFWEYEPAWSMLPDDLVDDEKGLEFGDETVRVIHPGRGHTDGDVVVQFVNRGIVHAGDLFVYDMYPYIDRRGGGSGVSWPDTLDRVLAIPAVKQYIPGHGPLAQRPDVERFQSYLRSLVSQVQQQAMQGRTLKEIQQSIDLHSFKLRGTPFFTSQDLNVQWVYEEITEKDEHR